MHTSHQHAHPSPPCSQNPRFNHTSLDVGKLYRLVSEQGGYDKVSGVCCACRSARRLLRISSAGAWDESAAEQQSRAETAPFPHQPHPLLICPARLAACLPATPLPVLQVCRLKLWAQVGRHFDPPKSMTNLRWAVAEAEAETASCTHIDMLLLPAQSSGAAAAY